MKLYAEVLIFKKSLQNVFLIGTVPNLTRYIALYREKASHYIYNGELKMYMYLLLNNN